MIWVPLSDEKVSCSAQGTTGIAHRRGWQRKNKPDQQK